jgi:hypothetical protein
MPKENVELLRELYSAHGLAAIRCVCPAPQGALRRGPKGNLGRPPLVIAFTSEVCSRHRGGGSRGRTSRREPLEVSVDGASPRW